jgi:hypothetical protein
MTYLAAILFLPWFLVLGTLFWLIPRAPRTAARRAFDVGALLAAAVAFVLALRWAHGYADPSHGGMWPQVLATSVGYGVFLGLLLVAWLLRRAWLGGTGRN